MSDVEAVPTFVVRVESPEIASVVEYIAYRVVFPVFGKLAPGA